MNVEKVKTAVISLSETYGELTFNAEIATGENNGMMYSVNGNITNGTVTKDNKSIAQFSSNAISQLSVNYFTADAEIRNEVLAGITTFCVSARNYIETATINVINQTNDED